MAQEKKVYTKEEIDQLKAWFDAQKLPQDMHISKSAYSPDLKKTLASLFEQAYDRFDNPKMYGSIHIIELIRQNIENNQK